MVVRNERDSVRRMRSEVDQSLHQLEGALETFDDEIREMCEEGVMEEKGKNWEPLSTLQKRRVVLDQLRKQAAEGVDDLKCASDEIDARVRLYRGLQPSRIRLTHSRGYEDARQWLNSIAARLYLVSSEIRRNNRKKSLTVNHNNRAAKTFYGFSAGLDADDRATVARIQFHMIRVDKMRNMLDRDKCLPDDVMSIEAEMDQHLLAIEQGEDPGEEAITMWECVGITESDVEPVEDEAAKACAALGEDACELADNAKASPTLRRKRAGKSKEKAAHAVAVECS